MKQTNKYPTFSRACQGSAKPHIPDPVLAESPGRGGGGPVGGERPSRVGLWLLPQPRHQGGPHDVTGGGARQAAGCGARA